MYPNWGKERREEVQKWVEQAKKRLLELDKDDKAFLQEQYEALCRKTSKGRAEAISAEMASFFWRSKTIRGILLRLEVEWIFRPVLCAGRNLGQVIRK